MNGKKGKIILIGLCSLGVSMLGAMYNPSIGEKVNYTRKSGLDFYYGNYSSDIFEIEYTRFDDSEDEESNGSISFEISDLDIDDETFRKELKIALNSIGAPDEEYEKLFDKINAGLSEKYQKRKKVIKEIKKKGYYKIGVSDNSKYEIDLIVEPDLDEGRNDLTIDLYNKDGFNYKDKSELTESSHHYSNEKTGLSIDYQVDDVSARITLEIPFKNTTDKEFKEQLKKAVYAIGGNSKDVELIHSTMNNNKDVKYFSKIIKGKGNYRIKVLSDFKYEVDFIECDVPFGSTLGDVEGSYIGYYEIELQTSKLLGYDLLG